MAKSAQEPVVHLSPTASVRGQVLTVDDCTKPVYTFKGIPFARPPVGDLRFKKPVPLDLWEGEKETIKHGYSPAQSTAFNHIFEQFPMPWPKEFDEDCLHLTVSSPDISGTCKLPVMAFLFGGGFQHGSVVCYPGTALASIGNVVYVAITYRVNYLGFFTTGDDVCPGNFGLWDQIEGLRWIQKYIRNFGGDPDNVTIFGESAGSMAVSIHHVMPQSKGLFHQALGESGVGSTPHMMLAKEDIKRINQKSAKALGLDEDASSEALFAAVNALTANEIIEKLGPAGSYQPCVDNDLLSDTYYNLYLQNKFTPSNYIFGVNTDEGAMFTTLFVNELYGGFKTMDDLKKFIDKTLDDFYPNKAKEGLAEAILSEYAVQADATEDDIFKAATCIFGDLLLLAPPLEAAKLHSAAASKGTYVYVFGYRTSISQNKPWVGADHGEELPLVFGFPFLTKTVTTKNKFEYTKEDKAMSKILISYWTNFAKTGNPNGEGLPEWKLHTPDEQNYLFIHTKCSQGCNYEQSRVKFWRETFPKL